MSHADVDLMRRIESLNIDDSTLFEDRVRELVKAACDVLAEADAEPGEPVSGVAIGMLEEALRPFTAS